MPEITMPEITMPEITMPEITMRRPLRADAQRNHDALIAAAHESFAEDGAAASLEDMARRAQVGIGTLYRHFPTRKDLFESVYVEEVDQLCRSADDLADLAPWDGLVAWLHRFADYVATKRAVAEALARDSELFSRCRDAIWAAGGPLLQRAQADGTARPDASFDDLLHLICGVTLLRSTEPGRLERVLGIALDGVRAQRPADKARPTNPARPADKARPAKAPRPARRAAK